MPTLNWIGKDKVVTHHNDVPYRVLDRKYTFGDEPDSGNKIIHGDNLEVLKALLPEYEGKISCIYIDPPYNTGNEGWVYNDNVNDPHIKKWLGQVVGDEVDDLTRHDKWLCMIYPRLVLLQKLLRRDGLIFVAIDDNEQPYLRMVLDEIFGKSNFIAQFIWRGGKRNLAKWVSTSHEYMIMYAKDLNYCSSLGISWKEQKQGIDEIYKAVGNSIKQAKGDYKQATLLLKDWFKKLPEGHPSKDHEHYCNIDATGVYCMDNVSRVGGGKYSVVSPLTGNVIAPPSRGWTYGKEEDFWKAYEEGIIEFTPNDTLPIFKRYLKDNEKQIVETVFYKDRRGSSRRLKEIMGSDAFPFPKDEEVLFRFFQIFTNKDAIILDSFAGSGTTAHAVLDLNRQDGGNRKFIISEMMDYAETLTAERVRRVMSGYGEGKNAVEGTGGSFDFYELGETIFDPVSGNLNDNADTEQIRRYVWFSETNSAYVAPSKDAHPFLLGSYQHNNYYFFYIKGEETCLDWDFLNTFTERDRAEMYIIYADRCVLTPEEMLKHNIVFKKIPRDIKRV